MRSVTLLWLTFALIGCRNSDKAISVDTGVSDATGPSDADGDGYSEDVDCNDADATVNPGAPEVCDGTDNDCDEEVDEGVIGEFYADADVDGYGAAEDTVEACTAPSGYVTTSNDCDDADADSFPGAAERCDAADNDCDGEIDEDVGEVWYADIDGDGYGDPETTTDDCDPPSGWVDDDTDCDDTSAESAPGLEEVCDGADNDCDGSTDEEVLSVWYTDADDDGYGSLDKTVEACTQPSGASEQAGDCDDGDYAISPAAMEICDERDNDCDGDIDEGAIDADIWYVDGDGDGFGDASTSTEACAAPSGFVDDAADCDDADATINPDGSEVCDGTDNDCDGDVDDDDASLDEGTASTWYADADGDGYGASDYTRAACAEPSDYSADPDDCDDAAAAVNPAAIEVCDEVDNDCDGDIDEGVTTTWYLDFDGDGYGSTAFSAQECSAPSGYGADATDCDDTDADINPAATEVCDEVDNDCDGDVDDDDAGLDASTGSTWYSDIDEDGYGDPSASAVACEAVSGEVADATDCDDADPEIHPDADEHCNGTDADCDGVTPETCASCLELLEEDPAAVDGLTVIDPDGASGTIAPFEVWCDQGADGGGWTLIQRTVWDWSDSEQLLTDYADWYGATVGDPDTGMAYRLAGERWSDLNVEQDILLVLTARDGDGTGGDCAPLYYQGTYASFTIDSTGTSLTGLSASVTMVNSSELSTVDQGSDSYCVTDYSAVPWFYGSCCTTCPTFFGSYWTDEAHPMVSYIQGTADLYGSVDADVCASGAAEPTEGSTGYFGINEMAFYLR